MATGTTEFIDNTTADVFIPEVWSKMTVDARKEAMVFARLVDGQFEGEARMGDTIHVPSKTHLSARTKSANTAITYETQTETNTDILINTNTYAAIAVESITELQTNRNQLEFYTDELGYALAMDIDDALAGLPDDLSTNTVGTMAVDLTDDDIIDAITKLDDAKVPQSERFMAMSPAQANAFIKRDKFVHNDYSRLQGSFQSAAQDRAYVTSFLDLPIYKSTNVEGSNAAGHDNAIFHRSTWALVVPMKMKRWFMTDVDYFVEKLAYEQVYGYKEMRDDHGVWAKGL